MSLILLCLGVLEQVAYHHRREPFALSVQSCVYLPLLSRRLAGPLHLQSRTEPSAGECQSFEKL